MVHIKHDVTACQTLPIKRSAALTMAVPTLLLTLATLLCASAAPAPERAPLFASFSEEEATLYQPDGDDEGGDVVPGAESIDVREFAARQRKQAKLEVSRWRRQKLRRAGSISSRLSALSDSRSSRVDY